MLWHALLDKDESCPTADLSGIGRPNGPVCSTGEPLNAHLFKFVLYTFSSSITRPSLGRDMPVCTVATTMIN